MNERALITLGILLTVSIVCGFFAIYKSSFRRTFWIIGLSFALLVFGGWTLVAVIAGITHRHLNSKGALILLSDGYVSWMLFNYLLEKIRMPKFNPHEDAEQ
jgi:hypothetical protein